MPHRRVNIKNIYVCSCISVRYIQEFFLYKKNNLSLIELLKRIKISQFSKKLYVQIMQNSISMRISDEFRKNVYKPTLEKLIDSYLQSLKIFLCRIFLKINF